MTIDPKNVTAPQAQQEPLLSLYEQAISLVQAPIPQDIEREMQVVDELVRSRSENLPDWMDDDNSSDTGSSMSSSMSTSSSSNSNFSPRSESSCTSNSCDDDDWKSSKSTKKNKLHELSKSNDSVVRKKRSYGRSVEDRSHRKKEQNKSAANRYRMKKKAEVEILLDEERDLAKRNDELQCQFDDVKREVKYLKALMRELFQMRGWL